MKKKVSRQIAVIFHSVDNETGCELEQDFFVDHFNGAGIAKAATEEMRNDIEEPEAPAYRCRSFVLANQKLSKSAAVILDDGDCLIAGIAYVANYIKIKQSIIRSQS